MMRWLASTGVLLLSLAAVACAQQAPVAMVTDVTGTAVRLGEAPSPLRLQTLLTDGERFRLDPEAKVRLIFMVDPVAGRQELLSGPCDVKVTEKGCRLVEGNPGSLQVERESRERVKVPNGQASRMAGYAARDLLVLSWPGTESPLRFSWVTLLEGPYRVSVYPEGVERPEWEAESNEPELVYTGPPLHEDATYTWRVSTGENQAEGRFRLPSRATRESLEQQRSEAEAELREHPDDPTPMVLLLNLYQEQLMFDEAAEVAERLLDLRPHEPELYRTLSGLYRILGKYDQAERAWKRAQEL